ncbi:MAG: hypothetical protein GX995_08605 [Clostridiales bacterium]|jgi:hypothetical protein|nr:hypothetical protein [Clostridiales bacterium]
MNEINLIDMLSYLDVDLLEDDNIENDLSISSVFKVITYAFAGAAIAAGLIGVIIKHKKKINIGKSLPKLPKRVLRLVTN